MSKETSPEIAELERAVAEAAQLNEKKKLLDRKRVERLYDQEMRNEAELERLSKFDLFGISPEYLKKMDEQHDMTVASMKDRMPFVNDMLTELVPFNYPNLILVGAKTGQGKTSFTSAANLALLRGKKRTLILSNEEMAVNYYNRVICLNKNWDINKLGDFTKEQHEELKKMRAIMYRARRLTIVDPDFEPMKNATRTLEGVKYLLDKVYEAQEAAGGECPYDAIFFDFFQKCHISKENPRMKKHEVLEDLSNYLDMMYKKIKAPITVLSQLKPESKEDTDFEHRIKESKSIFIPCTFALELIRDLDRSMTKCVCIKHRWSSKSGESLDMGFDRGHFVEYTMEFQQKVAERNERRDHADFMRNALKNIDDKKEA